MDALVGGCLEMRPSIAWINKINSQSSHRSGENVVSEKSGKGQGIFYSVKEFKIFFSSQGIL